PVTISYHVAGRENTEFQWHGHLSRYEGIGIDAQTRTVPVRISVDNPREVWKNGSIIQEENSGGLPALVRGMFVDCSIRTKPSQALVLLPKLALKPGNQVWQFEHDAFRSLPTANETTTPRQSAGLATKSKLNVDEWSAGRVRVLTEVKVISTIRLPSDPKQEYWIAEARPELLPGTLTVVTPLANIIGDGSDAARYKRSSTGSE
ncbi:MAG TPA: hypothetical protein VM260_20810, partial [Pirellula sp.]|nr:hypothetical protein [Pirellula sp.]